MKLFNLHRADNTKGFGIGEHFGICIINYLDPEVEPPVADPDDIRGAINYDMIVYWDGDPAEGETLDVVAYTGQTYGIETYPNLEWIIQSANPNLTPEQILYVVASLIVAIPPPPVDSVDSALLATTFADAAQTYGTGLQINLIEGSTSDDWWLLSASDHFNFWWYGWPALLCIEDIVYGIDPVTGYPYSTVTSPFRSSGSRAACTWPTPGSGSTWFSPSAMP